MEICVNCLDDAVAAEDSCDKAAADPTDPKRPDDTAGVPFDRIDANSAVQACLKAANIISDEPRLVYELGRALDAAKRYDEAIGFYRKAAAAGYAIAVFNVGHMYEEGTGVTKDLSIAKVWYQKAVDAGYEKAKLDISRIEQTSNLRQAPASSQNQPSTPQSDIVLDLNGLIDLSKAKSQKAPNAQPTVSGENTPTSIESNKPSSAKSSDEPPAEPAAPPAPTDSVQTASDGGTDILDRLSSHPWFVMEDNSCTIEFSGNSIGFSGCQNWDFVGITKSNSTTYDVDLFSTDGARYEAKVTFFGGRASIRGHKAECSPCVFSYGLQTYDVRLPPG
jgi:hypothetical protein